MNTPTSINDLPPEMICELFKHLPPRDLIICSMVNRRWRAIYTGFKLHSLVVTTGFRDRLLYKWYHSRPMTSQELCHLGFDRLENQPLLSNLKCLALDGVPMRFDLNSLNRFSQLVQLEIYGYPCDGKPVNLNLPKLSVLAFHFINVRSPLYIDCPVLTVMLYKREPPAKSLLTVKHPETVKRLETDMSGSKLAPFKNVECLVTEGFDLINEVTLLSLPKLKELYYNAGIKEPFRGLNGGIDILNMPDMLDILDRVKGALSKFLNSVRLLREPNFKFRFAGFLLTPKKLDEIDFGVQAGRESVYNEYVYMKNYHLIDPDVSLDFIERLDYTRLMRGTAGELPAGFFEKFPSLSSIEAGSAFVQDADHFLWFLKSLSPLRRLVLKYQFLNDEFYEQLPTSAPLLVELDLHDFRLDMNFDFISKFARLSWLDVRQKVPLNSAIWLVRWLGESEECIVCFHKCEISVMKRRYFNEFSLYDDLNRVEFDTEDLENIVNYLKGLESDAPKA